MDDSVLKLFFGIVQAAIVGVGVWLIKSTLGNRESVVELKKDMKALEDKVEELVKHQVTPESVRESMERALEKQEKVNEQRRVERSKIFKLETRQTIVEEIERIGPKIAREVVREMRGDTGKHRLPDLPERG